MKTPKHESEELKNGLRIYSNSLRTAAEKPDAFWTNQRARIAARFHHPVPALKRRMALLWAPAAIMVALCLFFFVQSGKAPSPDFAAGYDQRLLVEVEQALDQESPWALAPAALITQEIERTLERGSSLPPSKASN